MPLGIYIGYGDVGLQLWCIAELTLRLAGPNGTGTLCQTYGTEVAYPTPWHGNKSANHGALYYPYHNYTDEEPLKAVHSNSKTTA